MLRRITIEGFKSINALDVHLRRLSVLLGPNGSGKSNFIQVFELLGQMVRSQLQLSVALAGGASTLLHSGDYRAERISISTKFGVNGYSAALVPTDLEELIFETEVASFINQDKYTEPFLVDLGSGHRESRLHTSDRPTARWVGEKLASWVVYHFHDTSRSAPVKRAGELNDNDALRPDAGNLAAFLYRLQRSDPSSYGRILDAVRAVAPFFDEFHLRPDRLDPDRIRLEWKQRSSTAYFGPNALSDGTLRFICIATLLLQPEPPSLVLLDEPELGLHPYAINLVADMLEASEHQIIVSTQSVTLLDRMDIADIFIVEQEQSGTKLWRPTPDSLSQWVNDYSVGEIWEKNLIGGRPEPW
ncbi:MAG: AAA family ATPase [Acidimicrobiia bacterium]|nr:AAA family ATPase [Acidimicrobiia bacterium]MBP8180069.1 AAA family ATPase [Acidimicrobiia bacterium]